MAIARKAILVTGCLLFACASVQAQQTAQTPASPADTDPVKMGWIIVRFASSPKAANSNFDDISLPAYQAIAERLMLRK
jgi:hypothetical protein